jgi:hypothetical protein
LRAQLAAVGVGVARRALGSQSKEGTIEILQKDAGLFARIDLRGVMALVALQDSVLAFEAISGLGMIEAGPAWRRPVDQFEVAANVFRVTSRALRVAL